MSDERPPLVIGGGVAGLVTALALAPRPVRLVVRGRLGGDGSTLWAQGGIAAAVGEGDDPARHAEDTLRAGAGLCDEEVVRLVTESGPEAIARLAAWGVPFDRTPAGPWALGLEGGHSRRRIVHAHGDGTGRAILVALTERARRTPSILCDEETRVVDLVRDEAGIAGVHVVRADGTREFLPARRVVLATGGIGGLFPATTNPPSALGDGLVLAARLGARLRDLEFVQYHPTALDVGGRPLPLISEAVRGAGALLVDEEGRRFLAGRGREELEPRDVVARAIWTCRREGRRTFLDARRAPGEDFPRLFPWIHETCLRHGLDPRRDLLPVVPAAHYHMGGVAVDHWGRSDVPGLWAVGEVAASGLHGANRLASNSLLEAVVFGLRVAEDLARDPVRPPPPAQFASPVVDDENEKLERLLPIVGQTLGVERDAAGLRRGWEAVHALGPKSVASRAATLVLLMIASAYRRRETRGAHIRTDHPAPAPTGGRSSFVTLDRLARGLDDGEPACVA